MSNADAKAADLLGKIREFAAELEGEERQMFAVLLGPGVEALVVADEVTGFVSQNTEWSAGSLRENLALALATSGNPVERLSE